MKEIRGCGKCQNIQEVEMWVKRRCKGIGINHGNCLQLPPADGATCASCINGTEKVEPIVFYKTQIKK